MTKFLDKNEKREKMPLTKFLDKNEKREKMPLTKFHDKAKDKYTTEAEVTNTRQRIYMTETKEGTRPGTRLNDKREMADGQRESIYMTKDKMDNKNTANNRIKKQRHRPPYRETNPYTSNPQTCINLLFPSTLNHD